MLLFKGIEELNNVVEHAKQRHHIIGQYVVGSGGLVQDVGTKDQANSNFLKNFYETNYFWAVLLLLFWIRTFEPYFLCSGSTSDGVAVSAVEFENNVAFFVSCWMQNFMFFVSESKVLISLK